MNTRENILVLAEDLIRTRGYNAFSYGAIAAVLHIRNAAIHYHFPSKPDLGIRVVDKELEKIAHSRAECFTLPADQQLRKVAETFFASGRKGWICLNGSLTPDYLTLPDPLQKKVDTMCRTILDWMTECLEKGQKDKTLQFEGSAADRAPLVMSTLLSSLLLSRVLGGDTADRMLSRLLKDIEVKSLNQ